MEVAPAVLSFSRDGFMEELRGLYMAINATAATLGITTIEVTVPALPQNGAYIARPAKRQIVFCEDASQETDDKLDWYLYPDAPSRFLHHVNNLLQYSHGRGSFVINRTNGTTILPIFFDTNRDAGPEANAMRPAVDYELLDSLKTMTLDQMITTAPPAEIAKQRFIEQLTRQITSTRDGNPVNRPTAVRRPQPPTASKLTAA